MTNLSGLKMDPRTVQVFDKCCRGPGSVKEKRTHNGKDTSGEFVGMDPLEKRAGKWVIVRILGAGVS